MRVSGKTGEAQYALPVDGGEGRIVGARFGRDQLQALFTSLAEERKYSQILEDLRKLREYGLNCSWTYNQEARIWWQQNDFDAVLKALEVAISMRNDEPVYFANRAAVLFKLSKYTEAYLSFKETLKINKKFSFPAHYKAFFAASAFEVFRSGGLGILKEDVIELLRDAIESSAKKDENALSLGLEEMMRGLLTQ